MSAPLPVLLRVDEAAAMAGCSVASIRAAVKAGDLPHFRASRYVRIPEPAVVAWRDRERAPRPKMPREERMGRNRECVKRMYRARCVRDAIRQCNAPGLWRVYLRVKPTTYCGRQAERWSVWAVPAARPVDSAVVGLFVSVDTDGGVVASASGTLDARYRPVVEKAVALWRSARKEAKP